MSRIVIHNMTRRVEVHSTGRAGPAGLIWRDDGWMLGEKYQRNHALEHNGASYRAVSEHISTLDTEPGSGSGWGGTWQVLAQATFDPEPTINAAVGRSIAINMILGG